MRHAYRLPWVIVMLETLDTGAQHLTLAARRGRRLVVRAVRWLCRSPDEQLPSMICQRIKRTKVS